MLIEEHDSQVVGEAKHGNWDDFYIPALEVWAGILDPDAIEKQLNQLDDSDVTVERGSR